MSQAIIKKATLQDLDFIIKAIIEAEKSGLDIISYCTLFELQEQEFVKILKNILLEDIEGQQLCVSGFAIAFVDDIAVASCCSWVEGQEGMSSSIITGSLLGEYIPALNFKIGSSKNELLKDIHVEREKGSMQIESVYTIPEFRGQGLIRKLIQFHAAKSVLNRPDIKKAQIILADNNINALSAYQKMGFSLKSIYEGQAELLNYLPSNKRLLLETSINTFL